MISVTAATGEPSAAGGGGESAAAAARTAGIPAKSMRAEQQDYGRNGGGFEIGVMGGGFLVLGSWFEPRRARRIEVGPDLRAGLGGFEIEPRRTRRTRRQAPLARLGANRHDLPGFGRIRLDWAGLGDWR